MLDFPALAVGTYLRPPALGRVFYVNHTSGLNTNNGLDPGTPLHDITEALTNHVVDDRNDYIIVLDCWNGEPVFPIPVTRRRVHIIGLTLGSMLPTNFPSMTGGGVGAVFSLQGCHFSEIAGFDLQSDGQACIEMTVAMPASDVWIHHCTFGLTGAALYGILATVNDGPSFGMIENCQFGHAIAGDGIRLQAPTKVIIRNNVFHTVAGIGINIGLVACTLLGDIIGNLFFSPIAAHLAAGWAITIATGSGGAIIMGNRASQTGDSTGTNPYRDLSTGVLATCLNGWADNFAGQALSAGPDVV